MPLLLLPELAQALRRSSATTIYIGNLGKELSPAAASMTMSDKIAMMENYIGLQTIDAVIISPETQYESMKGRLIVQTQLEAKDIPYRHDRHLLSKAIELTLQQLGQRNSSPQAIK